MFHNKIMYPLESFFESHDKTLEFYEKLHNDKNVLVLVGYGGNGKSTLVKQLELMSPKDYYHFINEGNIVPRSDKKVIYVTNNMEDIELIKFQKLSYDVVEMKIIYI